MKLHYILLIKNGTYFCTKLWNNTIITWIKTENLKFFLFIDMVCNFGINSCYLFLILIVFVTSNLEEMQDK